MNKLQQELYDRIKTDSRILDFIERSALDGMWYVNATKFEDIWFSDQFYNTLGYTPAEAEVLGLSWDKLIVAEDEQLPLDAAAKMLADPDFDFDVEARYRHKKGNTVHLRSRGIVLYDEAGEPERLLGAYIDVTHGKRQEILLRRSQQIARIGNWELDLEAGRVHWDATTREIHAVPEDFEPTLETGLSFYKEGSSRELITKLVDEAITLNQSFDTELQLVTTDGREIWVRAIGQPEVVDGTCVRIYGIFQDIELRRRNEERMLNYSILEAKGKEMEQFSYVASHDLREPLLTIKGYLDVIREDYADQLPGEVKDFMATITGAADRMDELMKGLLDYSRLSKLKQLQRVDMEKLMKTVITDLTSAAVGVKIDYDYTDLPTVMGYPLELKVLFQNLIGNAIKYRRVNETLRIRITCADTPRGWEIKVHDNGIGIADKDLKRIFQLFQQLHQQGLYTGNGIGLANCKKIVELHGGKIWATSTLGEGSVFHFTILTREELQEDKAA